MDVYYSYSYLSSGWMFLQAIPLLTTPTTIITLLSPTVRETTRNLSSLPPTSLLLLSLLTLLLTGSLPLTTSLAHTSLAPDSLASGVSTDPTDPTAPYAVPTLTLTLVYHGTVAFYCWTQYTKGLGMPYFLAACVSGLLAAVGGWCLLFATGEGRISRKTGADKRTSGFPFKNKEADKRKAKI
ncbi:hypothetical protein BGX38DRAFT_1248174 [Terfezia claveryi]|nr:hypothetical protein BGX38DRAFT_1248174 [Terfezia claveryi]